MLAISNLTKRFGDNTVLEGIDLSLAEGEIVAIIGPSGTGKSTLLRCINFLETPTEGQIEIDGHRVNADSSNQKAIIELRKRAAFVFQNYALFANKTAQENIAEGLITVWKQPKSEAMATAASILTDIGLIDRKDAYPSSLSGGQQQRIGIGRAMAAHSKVILFDEPTSALDPEWVDEVLGLIKTLAERKQTMIIVTHEMQFAREIADRVVFMEGGRIVEQGPPSQLFETPQDPRTKQFLARALKA
ncbi:amino acid ABC transporter ATP-binding protein [Ferrimonas aestuarii]|uniref:Amino acid ABC transporter ATP-binding protein n=1 Tax=Ferrimonas aestuarii TaxID=2569539 RepID=A0A4U1BKN3_9GAMM|nr:amino acid ABC transporter ATP-binding protein [Ferrimonas aestuarii]TKB53049.1 amino acid ABC transporter ATP-binding protein [Ferrimonas aestuarii]